MTSDMDKDIFEASWEWEPDISRSERDLEEKKNDNHLHRKTLPEDFQGRGTKKMWLLQEGLQEEEEDFFTCNQRKAGTMAVSAGSGLVWYCWEEHGFMKCGQGQMEGMQVG